MRVQFALVFLGVLPLTTAGLAIADDEPGARTPDLVEVQRRLLDGTNGFRKAERGGTLAEDPKLAAAARDFAAFMARTDKYGHEADGHSPSDRVKVHGYDFCLVAENIAYQYDSKGFATDELAEGLLKAWKDSPGHRKNMLDPDVTDAGMGVAHSEKSGKYYAVQVFGRPKSAAIEFSVENRTAEDVEYTYEGEVQKLPPRTARAHTTCRPGTLTFSWVEKDGKPEEIHPRKGDRFAVTKEGDQLKLERPAA